MDNKILQIITEVVDYIRYNGVVDFSTIVDLALDNNYEDWLYVLVEYTDFFVAYFDDAVEYVEDMILEKTNS